MSDQFDNLLAIETSTRNLMLALSFGGDRLVKSNDLVERSHGQIITRKVANLFDSAQIKQTDLDGIVVSIGPGSFTGLRIGLALAKGMAAALNIPIIGISLYELAALKFGSSIRDFFVAAQVRRDELLVARIVDGLFDHDNVMPLPVSEIAVYVGAVPIVGLEVDITQSVPDASLIGGRATLEFDASDLLYLGRMKLEQGEQAEIGSLEPLYLQKSQAEIRFEQRQRQQSK
jgi:tRNA threonylcarbamoyladenosine biosynthesis protein TsaB